MSSSARLRRWVAVVCAAALTLSACSGTSAPPADGERPPPTSGSPTSVSPTTPSVAPNGLERFYAQKLTWGRCDGEFQCAKLTVPLDYADPTGTTITLALLRLRASGARLGSLVINPGGPGGSGVAYARAARAVISDNVRKRYDVVGFDPRGVGKSSPVECLTNKQLDELIAADPTPDDPAEVDSTVTLFRQLAERCKARGGALLGHVATREAARDIDVLRAALGDRKLTYLGKSYGTFLGATYAELFPRNVGRLVLDGALDPALTSEQISLGQAKGFEQATRAFVADCARTSSCPLGSTVDGGMERLRALLRQLDASPLPTDDGRKHTEGLGSLGIANAYTERGSDGSYPSNQNTVIYAVNCLDRPEKGGLAQVQRTVKEFTAQAPTWGAFLAWSELPCDYWPVTGTSAPGPIAASGSGPIVVVGTTRDPATPYQWAVNLAKQLDGGHLVTYRGDGHTAYLRGSRCVDNAVDAYLLRGTVPKANLTCG